MIVVSRSVTVPPRTSRPRASLPVVPLRTLSLTVGVPPYTLTAAYSFPSAVTRSITGAPPFTRTPDPRFFWNVTDCTTGAPPFTTTPPSLQLPPPSTTALEIRVPESACGFT